ncbi:addiction module antidote protein [Campylobacter sp. JMF_08 NE1]|uniref:addiction module antidote protein n=1 Tax=Campylobacter sp. JMF_08 NE1 TaxID=2983821 RepID=UPI0022E9EAD5|nr:addiction module antidote protein [Campylobacter sp. JMF_08 NE1]MDA3048574.1 putative addiction module antidote protein [Campylobacter sp. JMF_08 NE1]
MSVKFSKFTDNDMTELLNDQETRQHYLNEVIKGGDLEEFKRALFYLAKAEGVEKIAKKAELNRESFYKIFRPNSKPRFESIFKILKALDLNTTFAYSKA